MNLLDAEKPKEGFKTYHNDTIGTLGNVPFNKGVKSL
jgi:hypothetical protein